MVSNFVAEEFQAFLNLNRVQHVRSLPYHPSSNGLAERFIQTFHQLVVSFLLPNHTSPHATTGVAPDSLFLHIADKLEHV